MALFFVGIALFFVGTLIFNYLAFLAEIWKCRIDCRNLRTLMPLTFPLAHPTPAQPSRQSHPKPSIQMSAIPSRQTSASTQPDTKPSPPPLSEERLQAMCFEWFHNTYIDHRGRLFHNHQNPKNKIQGAILKAKGLIAGVSDFTFIDSPMRFIEMKIPGGVQSHDQKKFQALVESFGQYYYLCYSFDEFKGLINGFLGLNNPIKLDQNF